MLWMYICTCSMLLKGLLLSPLCKHVPIGIWLFLSNVFIDVYVELDIHPVLIQCLSWTEAKVLKCTYGRFYLFMFQITFLLKKIVQLFIKCHLCIHPQQNCRTMWREFCDFPEIFCWMLFLFEEQRAETFIMLDIKPLFHLPFVMFDLRSRAIQDKTWTLCFYYKTLKDNLVVNFAHNFPCFQTLKNCDDLCTT